MNARLYNANQGLHMLANQELTQFYLDGRQLFEAS
jgi:hypothetical protein